MTLPRPRIIALGLAPLLVGAAFWSTSLWFLAGFMLVPLFWGVDGATKRRGFLAFTFFTGVSALILAYPLFNFRSVQSLAVEGKTSAILLFIILAWALFLGFLAALTFFVSFSIFKNSIARLLLLPSAWVAFEIIKTALSFNLQWMFPGEPLIEFPALAVYARFGGSYLLSFMVVGFNIALYESLKFFFRQPAYRRYIPALLLVFVTAALVVNGSAKLGKSSPSGRYLDVLVVQPGSMHGVRPRDYYPELQKRTESILAQTGPISDQDLVILPGNYFTARRRDLAEDGLVPELAKLALGETVLTGFTLQENGKLNQANAIFSPGNQTQFAFKQYLLPFSEYAPKIFESLYSLPDGLSEYTPRESNVVTLPDGTGIGIISCSEEFVPWVAGEAVKNGARILVITGSNDDFFGPTAFKETLRAARFRALENNVFVIAALKSGISAVIDPSGRVVKKLDQNEVGILQARISF